VSVDLDPGTRLGAVAGALAQSQVLNVAKYNAACQVPERGDGRGLCGHPGEGQVYLSGLDT
jgi:hypothetical protein